MSTYLQKAPRAMRGYTPPKIVKKSLRILKELDGKPLRESIVPDLVNEAYEPVANELREKAIEYMETALKIFNNLKPLKKGEDERKFYEMFQGLEAVPAKYAGKVSKLLDAGKSIEVYRYLVPVPYWLFFAEQDSFHRLSDKGLGRRLLVAELKYSEEFGLLREPLNEGEVL
ncbi:hypothetical protein [Pyrococcus sp. ST04]|uniref:hypothetical protein n=1 Tax=Pyrococcus sp. ST04 TaxID=1183377 RepID=UPI0035245E1D